MLQRHAWPKLSPGDHRASEAETNPFDLLKTYVVALVCDSDIGTSLGWFLLAGPALSMFFQTKWRPSLRPLYLNLESQCHAWLSCGFTHRPVIVAPRVIRADNHAREGRAYRERAILQAAARVWAEGVAWETALELTRKALEPRAKGKGKGKGKGKRP